MTHTHPEAIEYEAAAPELERAACKEHGEQERTPTRVTADPASKAGANPPGCDRPGGSSQAVPS